MPRCHRGGMTAPRQRTNVPAMKGAIVGDGAGNGALDVRQPRCRTLPLVLSSPHSGANYPADLAAAARLDPLTLRRSEDSYVDQIFAAASELGAPLLAARFPRAYVDVNREAYELDPAMFSDPVAGLCQHPLAAGEDGPWHDRPGGGERRGDLRPQAEFRRGEAAHRDALFPLPRRVARPSRRHRRGLRGLSADRLPFDALSGKRRGRPGRCRRRARRLPRRLLRAACSWRRRASFSPGAVFPSRSTHPMPAGSPPGITASRSAHRHAMQIELNRGLYMDERSYRRKPGLRAHGARDGRADRASRVRDARLPRHPPPQRRRIGRIKSICDAPRD